VGHPQRFRRSTTASCPENAVGPSSARTAAASATEGVKAGISSLSVDAPVIPTALGDSVVPLYPAVDGAPGSWTSGFDGSGVGVPLIDSGSIPVARLVLLEHAGHMPMLERPEQFSRAVLEFLSEGR